MMCERPRHQTGEKTQFIIKSKQTNVKQNVFDIPLDLHTLKSFSWGGSPLYINCFFCHSGSQYWCLCPLKSWPSFSGCFFWGDGLDNPQANRDRDTRTSLAILECSWLNWWRNKLRAGLYTRNIPMNATRIVGQVLCVPSHHSQKLLMKFWSVCHTPSDKVRENSGFALKLTAQFDKIAVGPHWPPLQRT